MLIIFKWDKELFILYNIEKALNPFLVRLRFEVLLIVFKGRGKLMSSDDAFNFAVLYELEIGVGFDKFLKFRFFGFRFWCRFRLGEDVLGFVGLVVFRRHRLLVLYFG